MHTYTDFYTAKTSLLLTAWGTNIKGWLSKNAKQQSRMHSIKNVKLYWVIAFARNKERTLVLH